MADVQSNIHVNIDTSDALASLKLLQRQISAFHTQMAKSGTAAAAVSANQAQNLMNAINATGQFQASMRKVTTSTEHFTDALERNKLTSREYFRYTGAATKTFGRLFKSEFETINKVARERVKDIQTQYIKLGRGANGALESIAVRPLTLDMKNLGTQTAIAAQRQQLLNQLLKQGSTNLLNFGKNTQWAGRQLMVGFTIPLAMLGAQASKTFMAMEEQAIRFKRVYGEMFTTQEETDAMIKQIQTLAKEYTKYGVAVEDTMKMAADAAAMGKMGAELTAQVAQATRLAVLGGVEQTQALETTISVTNAFGVATEDLAKKIDFLNAVENQTVVSIEDLTIAIPKAGPVVQQLGGDVEDLAFFLTAMKEGGINASEGANALKSGLASLINPSKKASAFLKDLGVNITGIVEANKGDIKATVVGFAQALDTLDPLNRARAIEQLFGKFQFSRLSTLFQNVTAQGTQAQRVLGLTRATTEELAILSQRELDKIQNTTSYKFKKSMEDLKIALAPVGEQFLKALTPILEFVGKVLDKFNNLGDGTKKFLTVFTVAVAGIGPVLLMTFGLIANAAANIIKLFANMKSMYNRTGNASTVLGEQTNYLTKEQLEASAVAASLDQVHQKLRQTFTSETTAVNSLAAAYRRAIAAQAGFTGPVRGGGRTPGLKKYSTGTTEVPGSGSRDTVPTMLTPGEAVIPAKAAQDPANRPMIAQLIAGKRVQGFNGGTPEVTADGQTQKTHVGGKSEQKLISDIIKNNPFMGDDQKAKLRALEAILVSQGLKPTTATLHKLMFTFPASMNMSMSSGVGIPAQNFIDAWDKLGPNKWEASKISGAVADPFDKAMIEMIKQDLADKKITHVNDDYVKKIFTERIPAERPDIAKTAGYTQAEKLYNTSTQFLLGRGLGNTPEESRKILEDAVKKGAIKSFDIQEREGTGKTNAGKIVTGSATVTLNDGTVVNMNRLGSGHRVNISQDEKSQARSNAATERARAKAIAQRAADLPSQSKMTVLERVADAATKTVSGKLPPTDFGKQIAPSSGYSFKEASFMGGLYERPDGKKVFVKPMMSELDAIAEKRATDFARVVQGLDTPEQNIKTMIDPSDPQGKRKIIVLESEFNKNFDTKNIPKTFTQEQYFRQLVAANLRGDKDLKAGNLGGNILTDVGPAGVFDSASGERKLSKKMPSLEQMAEENLKGLPEKSKANPQNSPNWFANATKDIALNLTPDQYHKAMRDEIKRQISLMVPYLADMPDNDPLKPQYTKMLARLRAGLKVDWKKLHQKHSSILVKPDEVQEDAKGNTKPIPTEPNNGKFKSDSGIKDTRIASKEVESSVRQRPRLRGKANAPEAMSTTTAAIVDGARGSVAEAKAVGANIGTTLSQSAAAASRTMLYGTGPVDADAKSLRRQIEKRQRAEAKTQAKANASKTALYGTTGPIDPVMRGRRKQAALEEKRSKLAAKVAYQQSVIDARAAEEAKKRTPLGRVKTFVENREAKRQAKIDAGKRPGMGMGGALGIASGVAMIGSMAPGKVGEISQKVMMPLMGLAMILPMLKSPMAAVAIGLTATVGSFVALRMAFDKAANKVLEENEKFRGSSSAINEIAKFSGKVTASEQMDLRRQNSFSMLGAATGKTTYGEAFIQTKEGKALTERISQQNAAGKGNVAAQDLSGQLSAAIMSGAMDMGQAKSLAMNAARQAGDMSIGLKVIGQLETLLGPNGENLEKDPYNVRIKMINDNATKMQGSLDNIKNANPITKMAGQKTVQMAGIGASAAGGAAIGATLGAALGSVVPVLGNAVGAIIGGGIGAAAGAIGGYFASKKFAAQAGQLGAAYAVDAKIAMEQNKQMLDSMDMYYQNKIEELKLQGKINEARELENKYLGEKGKMGERDKLTAAQAKMQADIVSQYNSAGGMQESMMSGMKKAVSAKYKDDPNQLAYVDVVNTQAGNLRKDGLIDSGQEFLIQAKMASGDIPPAVFRSLLGMAAENKDIAPKMMNIITKFSGATSESIGVAAQNILGADKVINKEVQTSFITRVEAFEKDSDALDFTKNIIKLNNLNAVIPSDVMVSYYTDPKNKEQYEKLNTMLDGIEGKKDLTATFVYEIMPEVKGTAAFDEAYFNTLTEDQQKVYTTTIASLINIPDPQIIESEDFKAWRKESGPLGGAGVTGSKAYIIQKYKEAQGQKAVVDNVQVNANAPVSTGGDKGGGSKVESSPLDDLVKKLRDVRKNQIKVTEGWSASRKALDSLFGGKKTIDVFSGIENDIRKLGGSQDFIEMIVGMDPKEYEKRKNSLFKFDNKGNIIALKRDAKNIQEAMNSIAMGDWNSSMEAESKALDDQSKAFNRIAALGVPVANAYDLITDKTIAQAIANGVNDKTLKTLISRYKGLAVAQEKSAAIQATKTDIAQFKKDRVQEDRIRSKYSSETAFAIGSDENLKAMESAIAAQQSRVNSLISKGADRGQIMAAQKELNSMISDFDERLNQLKNTIGFMQDMFDEGFGNAMEAFDVQETALQIKFNLDTKESAKIIEEAQNTIAGIQYKIDDKEASLKAIEDQEQKINEKYDERIKALDEVEKANATITNQQRGQLSLAEALTSGDIAAAARAAQDMRAQQAADAVTKQKDAVEQSRQYELNSVKAYDPTTKSYRTRKELEADIKKLQDEIFDLEEKKIEPAQEFIRLKQVQLDKDVENLTVLGKTRDAWEAIKNQVDLAMINSKKFIESMQLALNTQGKLIQGYNNQQASGNDPIVPAAYTPAPVVPGETPEQKAAREAADRAAKAAADKAAADAKAAAEAKAKADAAAAEAARIAAINANINVPSFLASQESGAIGAASIAAKMAAAVKPKTAAEIVAERKAKYGYLSKGGFVPKYFAAGGFAKGTDRIPAMLTPGEFVMSKYAVDSYGVENLKKINNGDTPSGAVYNNTYTLTVNAKTDANPNEIAQAVMATIKQVDDRRIRGIGINGR
jgi:TP901 family phage tail tape measure protein